MNPPPKSRPYLPCTLSTYLPSPNMVVFSLCVFCVTLCCVTHFLQATKMTCPTGSKANSHNEQRLSTPDENQAVPDFKTLKKKALTILKERLGKKILTKKQREEVTKIISEADRGVAENILKMTGVRTEGLSTTRMIELVAENILKMTGVRT